MARLEHQRDKVRKKQERAQAKVDGVPVDDETTPELDAEAAAAAQLRAEAQPRANAQQRGSSAEPAAQQHATEPPNAP